MLTSPSRPRPRKTHHSECPQRSSSFLAPPRFPRTDRVQAIVETPVLGPALFAALFPWISGADMKKAMVKYPRMSHLFALVRDESSGEVTEEGKISYHLGIKDKERLRTVLRRALRILIAAGATEVGTYRSYGQRLTREGANKEDIEKFLDSLTVLGGIQSRHEHWTLYCLAHQMRSCRMGSSEEHGTVRVGR